MRPRLLAVLGAGVHRRRPEARASAVRRLRTHIKNIGYYLVLESGRLLFLTIFDDLDMKYCGF